MDLKQIEKLMSAMGQNGMKRMVLKQKDFELELEKEGAVCPRHHTASAPEPVATAAAPVEVVSSKKEEGGTYITSPMVGTYYSAASPDEALFVSAGDSVQPDTVVCIVEAMKVMNEVKAGVSGNVVEVLLKNGDPVEFGTKLFRVT